MLKFEKPMLAVTFIILFYSTLAKAQIIVGAACSPTVPASIITTKSQNLIEGAVQCIPNDAGQYYWQPLGAGIARYDTTASCTIAGTLRWNGSSIQYCDGANWQAFVSGNGKLHWDGNWTGNNYWCDTGFHIVAFHYDCGCSNSASWFECQTN